jgi:hypothetical protein
MPESKDARGFSGWLLEKRQDDFAARQALGKETVIHAH